MTCWPSPFLGHGASKSGEAGGKQRGANQSNFASWVQPSQQRPQLGAGSSFCVTDRRRASTIDSPPAEIPIGVNDEVLDLEEAVLAEIPVSDLLCVEVVSCGPIRRPAYSAASSTSGGHDIIDSQI